MRLQRSNFDSSGEQRHWYTQPKSGVEILRESENWYHLHLQISFFFFIESWDNLTLLSNLILVSLNKLHPCKYFHAPTGLSIFTTHILWKIIFWWNHDNSMASLWYTKFHVVYWISKFWICKIIESIWKACGSET